MEVYKHDTFPKKRAIEHLGKYLKTSNYSDWDAYHNTGMDILAMDVQGRKVSVQEDNLERGLLNWVQKDPVR